MQNFKQESDFEKIQNQLLRIRDMLDDMSPIESTEVLIYILISAAMSHETNAELHSSDFSSETHLNALHLVETWINETFQLIQDANRIH